MFQENDCESKFKLTLDDCLFARNMIYPNWLRLQDLGRLTALSINGNKTIIDILPLSFALEEFFSLESLELVNMRLAHLKENIFTGLTSLRTIHVARMHLTTIDANILSPVPNLFSLLFEEISEVPFDIKNLTGSSNLANTRIVSLRENNFGGLINSKTFSAIQSAKSLYLSHSKISAIDSHSFDALQHSLQLLDLQGNALKALAPDLFDGILGRSDVSLFLSNNPWQCDCSILGLKTLLQKHEKAIKDFSRLKCAAPETLKDTHITMVDVCSPVDCEASIDDKTNEFVEINSLKCGTLFMLKRSIRLRISGDLKNGIITVTLDQIHPEFLLLIRNEHRNATICWSGLKLTMQLFLSDQHFVHLNFRFCVLDQRKAFSSPLDCIQYNFLQNSAFNSRKQMPKSKRYQIVYLLAMASSLALVSIGLGILISSFLFEAPNDIEFGEKMRNEYARSSHASTTVPFPFDAIRWRMGVERAIDDQPSTPEYLHTYESLESFRSLSSTRPTLPLRPPFCRRFSI